MGGCKAANLVHGPCGQSLFPGFRARILRVGGKRDCVFLLGPRTKAALQGLLCCLSHAGGNLSSAESSGGVQCWGCSSCGLEQEHQLPVKMRKKIALYLSLFLLLNVLRDLKQQFPSSVGFDPLVPHAFVQKRVQVALHE